jgi:hypothetical protein
MNHRNRALLDLAHRVDKCMNCGQWSPGCEPAHQNGQDSGKGIGIKGHDHRHAALCHACHSWLDQGGKRSPCGQWAADRAQKAEMWTRAHMATMDYYWEQKWLRVT